MTARLRFAELFNVSRETMGHLDDYEVALRKWNPAINLVAKSTLDGLWSRHFADSAQLFELAPENARCWVDLGSGGGFPGLVIAILARERAPSLQVFLVESDGRKSAFLSTVARAVGANVKIVTDRIETLQGPAADVLSARALAPLDKLLGYTEKLLNPGGIALFPKGASYERELEEARKHWRFDLEQHRSITDPAGRILSIGAVSRA